MVAITMESLLADLAKIKDQGMQSNLTAAIKAIQMLGQEMYGAFVEKKEVKVSTEESLTEEELDRKIQENAEKSNLRLSPRHTRH